MPRRAVRAIVIRGNELLVMHRNKFGEEYDTLPGGGVELGETLETALDRELYEETGIQIGSKRLVFTEGKFDDFGIQNIFLCEYVSGEPQLAIDSEEALINKLGKNTYTPMWVAFEALPGRPFLSEALKDAVIAGYENGFPDSVIEIG